jgi:hypothetical protein
MSISYEEALSTLQSMFGEPWTRDTLDGVLRHHQGHMENTVDQILRYGDRDPQALVDALAAGIDPEASAVTQDEALARQLAQEGRSTTSSRSKPSTSGGSSGAKKGRGTPTALPSDFLRIPSAQASTAPTAASTTPTTQMDSDEALARMLQDELFTEELAQNPDFAHLARGRPNTSGGQPSRSNPRPASARQSESTRRAAAGGDQPDIMGKITQLGDNAKRRLQTLAAQFNNAKDKRTNNNAQGGGQSDTANVAAGERRGLLDNDHDDMELAARKDL